MYCKNCNLHKEYGFCDNCLEPLNLEQLKDYNDYCQFIVDFYLKSGQWDGLQGRDLKRWLNNFDDNVLDRYFAIRLLTQVIYYSENDMELLLREGIFNRIIGEECVLPIQYKNQFRFGNKQLMLLQQNELNQTLFTPLLVGPSPDESGNQLMRMLTQRLLINKSKVKFHCFLDNYGDAHDNKRLIIIDDCIGSGQQCSDFWENSTVMSGELLRDWCKKYNIEVFYFVLVGFLDTIKKLTTDFQDLKIRCMEILDDRHRVFDNNSLYWEDSAELSKAKNYFETIATNNNFSLAGFNSLDFALILHKTIPDWNVPILWKQRPNWSFLLQRKNSNV